MASSSSSRSSTWLLPCLGKLHLARPLPRPPPPLLGEDADVPDSMLGARRIASAASDAKATATPSAVASGTDAEAGDGDGNIGTNACATSSAVFGESAW